MQLANKPLISVIMPVYNVDEQYLRECIESVIRQMYPYWELCIADDCSSMPHIKKVLHEYGGKDPRIKTVYRNENGHISACTNTALDSASGEYLAFLDHDDILSPCALYEVAKAINVNPDADLIYSDEDKLLGEERIRPFFKAFIPRKMIGYMNYICHLAVYKTEVVKKLGGLRTGYEGAQDWDLARRVMSQSDNLVHIPKILYHWRITQNSTALDESVKDYVKNAQKKVKIDARKK